MKKFTYDLGNGWSLDQFVGENTDINGQAKETFVFCKDDKEEIALNNESVKKLREIFKRINN